MIKYHPLKPSHLILSPYSPLPTPTPPPLAPPHPYTPSPCPSSPLHPKAFHEASFGIVSWTLTGSMMVAVNMGENLVGIAPGECPALAETQKALAIAAAANPSTLQQGFDTPRNTDENFHHVEYMLPYAFGGREQAAASSEQQAASSMQQAAASSMQQAAASSEQAAASSE